MLLALYRGKGELGDVSARAPCQAGALGSAAIAMMLAAMLCTAATAASATTIEEAMAQAYDSNPNLEAARKELERTDELVSQAVAGWRPQAAATVGGGWIKDLSGGEKNTNNSQSQFSSTDGPTAVLNLTAQQPIYNFYNGPRIREAEQTTKSQRARLLLQLLRRRRGRRLPGRGAVGSTAAVRHRL